MRSDNPILKIIEEEKAEDVLRKRKEIEAHEKARADADRKERVDRVRKIPQRVIITGLDIPFMDLVAILIKLTLASLPALLIVTLITIVFVVVLAPFSMIMGG